MSKNRLIETYGIEKIKHGLHLLLYGAGGKKTLELVARYADAWDYGLCPYEEFWIKYQSSRIIVTLLVEIMKR
jgi:hypothetical protein